MFYSEALLTRQDSPLAHVWLVGSLNKKLTRREINSTDIIKSVQIIRDKEQGALALRLEGHLLLGVSRIYNFKVKNLESDCVVAFSELKAAFKPGNVNLPDTTSPADLLASLLPGNQTISLGGGAAGDHGLILLGSSSNRGGSSNTLQNTLTDFNSLLPDLPAEMGGDLLFSQIPGATNRNSSAIERGDFNFSLLSGPGDLMTITGKRPAGVARREDITLQSNFDESVEIGRHRGGLDDDDDDDDDDGVNINLNLGDDNDDQNQTIEFGRGVGSALDDDDDDVLPPMMIPDDDDEAGFGIFNNPATPAGGNDLGASINVLSDENDEAIAAAAADDELTAAEQQKKKRINKARLDNSIEITLPRADSLSQSLSESQLEALKAIQKDHPRLPSDPIKYGLLSLTDSHAKLLEFVSNPFDNQILNPKFIGDLLKRKRALEEGGAAIADQLNHVPIPSAYDDNDYIPLQMPDDDEEPAQKSQRLDENGNRGIRREISFEESPSAIHDDEEDQSRLLEYEEEEDDFSGGDIFGSTQPNGSQSQSTSSQQQSNVSSISRYTIIAAQKLREGLEIEDSIAFSELSEGGRRSDKVKMFFEMLVLATKDAISITQPKAFADFNISAKPKLHNPMWDDVEVTA